MMVEALLNYESRREGCYFKKFTNSYFYPQNMKIQVEKTNKAHFLNRLVSKTHMDGGFEDPNFAKKPRNWRKL